MIKRVFGNELKAHINVFCAVRKFNSDKSCLKLITSCMVDVNAIGIYDSCSKSGPDFSKNCKRNRELAWENFQIEIRTQVGFFPKVVKRLIYYFSLLNIYNRMKNAFPYALLLALFSCLFAHVRGGRTLRRM